MAHTNEAFEALSLTFRGVEVHNAPAQRPRDPGTLEKVFMPVVPELRVARGMWWLENRKKVLEIADHIEKCKSKTLKKIGLNCSEFRLETFKHMHVLDRLTDVVKLKQMSEDGNSTPTNPSFNAATGDPIDTDVILSLPISTKIGDEHINFLIAELKPNPDLPPKLKVEGKGYRLELLEPIENGKVTWNVTFPKYPYPEVKPNN